MPNALEIPAVATSCRDCIFAQYSGNEQQDCQFDRLEKFEENGAEIVGQDDSYKRYFLIVGRFCNACRNYDWGDQHQSTEWMDIVSKEFRTRVRFIVYVDSSHTMEDVEKSLDSVLGQGHPPFGVTVLVNNAAEETREYLKLLRRKSVNFPWEVRQVVLDEHGEQPATGTAVDYAVAHMDQSCTFYTVGTAGYEWPADYLTVLEQALNYEMMRFVAIHPDENGNGALMNTVLHNKWLVGNRGMPVFEKVAEVAAQEETSHMIKTWDEVKSCVSPA